MEAAQGTILQVRSSMRYIPRPLRIFMNIWYPRGGIRIVGIGKRSPHGFWCVYSFPLWLAD